MVSLLTNDDQVEDPDMKESSSSSTTSNGLNLAAELNMASDWNQKDQETTIQSKDQRMKEMMVMMLTISSQN